MEFTPVFTSLVIILFITFFLKRWCIRNLNVPPGPKPWPIIGNLNLIGSLPHRSFHQLSKTYGPLMQLSFGSFPVVVASSAETAKAVLKTHDAALAYRSTTAAGKYTAYNYTDITYANYGPYWRQLRKICLTELFTPKRLDSYEYIRTEELRSMLHGLYECTGSPVVLKDYLSMFNLYNISRIVLGKRVSEMDWVSPDEFREMLDELFLLNGVMNIGDWIPWLQWMDLQGYVKRMKVIGGRFDRFFESVFDAHEERRRREGEEFVVRDMVDVLMELVDDPSLEVKIERDNVKGFIQDLIAGGTESSYVTVEWAISELLKQPELFEKATEELDRVIGHDRWVEEKYLHQLPFIEAIMKETMRLHPVTPLPIPRFASSNITINNHTIIAGTRVLINTWSIGRDPLVWTVAPEEFRPERFVGSSIDVKGQNYELLPFGAGRRMCPGYALGMKMVLLSLANLLHGFRWRLPEGMNVKDMSMEEVFGLSIPRKVPLEVAVEARLQEHLYAF